MKSNQSFITGTALLFISIVISFVITNILPNILSVYWFHTKGATINVSEITIFIVSLIITLVMWIIGLYWKSSAKKIILEEIEAHFKNNPPRKIPLRRRENV